MQASSVASVCCLIQYEGLEKLYQKHKDAGLVILGFPCDQFGHQEPGDESAIQEFCQAGANTNVAMPLRPPPSSVGPTGLRPPSLPLRSVWYGSDVIQQAAIKKSLLKATRAHPSTCELSS
jgi:hypothetical protein